MAENNDNWPEEGELLVCTVSNVRENGAYLTLDGYGSREGFVFVGEVASGWVKNIRNHIRVGQRVVAKVIGVKKDRERVDLSIKSVSEERRRDTIQSWKNEQRAHQLLKVLGEKVGWSPEETSSSGDELSDAFGGLYSAFEEAAMNEGALQDAGFEGDWLQPFIEIAVENIIPPFVEIRGTLTLSINATNGVDVIREALLAAEAFSSPEEEIEITCHYNGAPEYRLELKAPDFKTAESLWEQVTSASVDYVVASGGEAEAYRE